MDEDCSKQLAEFVTYAKSLKGDERGEAQVFLLDRLFRAPSSPRFSTQRGRARPSKTASRKRSDAVPRLRRLRLEAHRPHRNESRGEDLSRHLLQAFHLPGRACPQPPARAGVVLCNFDEFWVYDFNQDIHQPQDTITLEKLSSRRTTSTAYIPRPCEIKVREVEESYLERAQPPGNNQRSTVTFAETNARTKYSEPEKTLALEPLLGHSKIPLRDSRPHTGKSSTGSESNPTRNRRPPSRTWRSGGCYRASGRVAAWPRKEVEKRDRVLRLFRQGAIGNPSPYARRCRQPRSPAIHHEVRRDAPAFHEADGQ